MELLRSELRMSFYGNGDYSGDLSTRSKSARDTCCDAAYCSPAGAS
jgi:hypothetical protein